MRARATHIIRSGLVFLAIASLVLISVPAFAKSAPPAIAQRSIAAAPAQAPVTINLCATTGSVTMPDSVVVPIWGYAQDLGSGCGAAQLPGPPLFVNVNDVVTINLTNNLAEPTSMIFLGQSPVTPTMVVGSGVAGLLTLEANPGETVSYSFTASAPGTYHYQSGTLGPTSQVAMGLYGALIVRPTASSQAYDGPASVYGFTEEAVLVLSEIDPAFNASPATFNMVNYDPKYWLINGEAYPATITPTPIQVNAGDRLLIRYVNAGLVHHTMTLLGRHQRAIAKDAYPLTFPFDLVAETIPSGSTADMIVTIPSGAALGTRYALYNRQMRLTNVAAFPGGMMTFITVVP